AVCSPDLLPRRRAARLAGDHDLPGAIFERRPQQLQLGGLSGALDPLEGDQPARVTPAATAGSDADQLGHPDLGAALGAGGGVRVLVGGEQAAATRAGLGQRRLPEGEVAVGVAVAAVEGLAALGPLGDDLALAALGAGPERLLAKVLDAPALGVVGAAKERPEAAAALDHRLAALGAGHVGQLGLGLLGGLLGRLVGVAPVLAVRVAAAGEEPAVAAP